MKYTEEEIELLAKSMYKAVKKALGGKNLSESQLKAKMKGTKDAIDDLEDPNYRAEAKESTPPRRTANMNKSKGLDKLKKFKKKLAKKNKNRCWDGYEPVPGKEPYSEGSCRKK